MSRIKGAELEALRAAVAPLDTAEHRARYVAGDFPRADRVKDLDKRYRWDLLHASGFDLLPLYAGRNGVRDSHVDTALRAIVPVLER